MQVTKDDAIAAIPILYLGPPEYLSGHSREVKSETESTCLNLTIDTGQVFAGGSPVSSTGDTIRVLARH